MAGTARVAGTNYGIEMGKTLINGTSYTIGGGGVKSVRLVVFKDGLAPYLNMVGTQSYTYPCRFLACCVENQSSALGMGAAITLKRSGDSYQQALSYVVNGTTWDVWGVYTGWTNTATAQWIAFIDEPTGELLNFINSAAQFNQVINLA